MEQPHVVQRINPLVLSTERRYLDFTASPGDLPAAPTSLRRLSAVDPRRLIAAVTKDGGVSPLSSQWWTTGRTPPCSPTWTPGTGRRWWPRG